MKTSLPAGILSEELPDWAEWLAQDKDGSWWAYEAEPNRHSSGWYENEVGRSRKLGESRVETAWQNSLTRILESGY